MKKEIKIIILTLLILMLSISSCYGSEYEYNLRIRIRAPRQYNEQALLDGYENITVYDKGSGNMLELFQLNNDRLRIMMDSYYNSNYNLVEQGESNAIIGPYHVKVKNKEYNNYLDVKNEIDNLVAEVGGVFYPYYNGTDYEIYIGSFVNSDCANDMLSKLNQNGLNGEIKNGNTKNIMALDNKSDIVFMYSSNYNIYFSSNNSDLSCKMIEIDKKTYRGLMGFYIIDGVKIISVNYVDIESYLYGVVPNEIISSWPEESIKVQAVCSRTYAASAIDTKIFSVYDLEDNQNSQVYRGYSSEKAVTNKAVNDTKKEMIYYDNSLIQAFFHSTSGGRTENSENIWFEAVPYLRAVDDEYSNISPQTEWTKTATKEYIIQKLKDDLKDINDLYGIEITKVSENYRVLECIFITDKGKITYEKENVRRILGYDFLMSSWFTIENSNFVYFTNKEYVDSMINEDNLNNKDEEKDNNSILDDIIIAENSKNKEQNSNKLDELNALESGSLSDKYIISKSGTVSMCNNVAFICSKGVTEQNYNTSEYIFNGRGWGHGIGLSQYGAKEMANKGFSYSEIIKHYYTGVEIR